jgi:hypothetical protein
MHSLTSAKRARGSAGGVVLLLVAIVALLFLIATCRDGSPGTPKSVEQVQAPGVSIQRVVGSYLHSDGIRMITIKEAYDDSGWNGRLSFSPPVGDWAHVVRCRVSGTDLAVEIPASSGRVIVKLFKLDGPDTVSGTISPWDGIFSRVR